MKKLLFILLPPIFACIVFFSAMFIFAKTDKGKGALQVTATPKADVYLDGKLLGKSPFCRCDLPNMIPVGEHSIRLVSQDTSMQPFEQKIPINKSVITVIDVTFGEKNTTSASIISLDPLPDANMTQIFATSFPDKAKIFLDKNASGNTPILLKDVTDSDHELLFDKDGYQTNVLHVHTVKGYTLSAVTFLSIKTDVHATSSALPIASVSGTPIPLPSHIGNVSGTPTPTLTTKTSLTPKITPTLTKSSSGQVLILQTPTGFLRVRSTPGGSEVGQVSPGQSFTFLDEQSGWYKIQLSDGTMGWVSSQYSKKQ